MMEKDTQEKDSGYSDWSNIEKLTKKSIIMLQLTKISKISCSEFREGYIEKKPLNVNGTIIITEIYHEDKRRAYINAVNYLSDLLRPDFDDVMKEEEKKINFAMEAKWEELKSKGEEYTFFTDEELKYSRLLFQGMNEFFKRDNYFDESEGVTESAAAYGY